jgi:hypothetical protein
MSMLLVEITDYLLGRVKEKTSDIDAFFVDALRQKFESIDHECRLADALEEANPDDVFIADGAPDPDFDYDRWIPQRAELRRMFKENRRKIMRELRARNAGQPVPPSDDESDNIEYPMSEINLNLPDDLVMRLNEECTSPESMNFFIANTIWNHLESPA